MYKKTNHEQEKINVIKLVWPVRSETDRIQSQSKVCYKMALHSGAKEIA
jgi:hypothetical protein